MELITRHPPFIAFDPWDRQAKARTEAAPHVDQPHPSHPPKMDDFRGFESEGALSGGRQGKVFLIRFVFESALRRSS